MKNTNKGENAVTGTALGYQPTSDEAMKLAGSLQVRQYSKVNALRIISTGKAFGPPPYYGEQPYSGRRILQGIKAGEAELRKK